MQTQLACQYIEDKLMQCLPARLTYHTVLHTLDVAEQAARIARAEGITDQELLDVLQTAAYYHDAGFLRTYQEHEEESCRIALEVLPDYDYRPDQITQVCQLIRATRMPQSPTTLLQAVLCDADLDYLGRDDYPRISELLRLEWISYGLLDDPSQWSNIQRSFLSSHQYFTLTNQQDREPHKLQALALLQIQGAS